MRGKSAKAPDPVNWDYRAITVDEFPVAALYEYARCCPWVVALWNQWLNTSIPGVARFEWGPPVPDPARPVRVGTALRDEYPDGVPLTHKPDVIADSLSGSFPLFLRRAGLAPLLLQSPEFPEPWLSLDPDVRQRLVRRVPVGGVSRAFRDVVKVPLGGEITYGQALKAKAKSFGGDITFRVAVDFSQGLECIRADFNRWLHEKRATLREAGAIPKRLLHQGRAVGINYDALTWLACYNFQTAGISYAAARKATKNRRIVMPAPDPRIPMPHFPQDSTWSANASRAKRLMDWLFGNPISSPFEHTATLKELRKNLD